MKNIFVVGIIFLFIGVAVQPSMATIQPKNIANEPKEFLFQTLIDIGNNQDVQEIFEQFGLLEFNLNFRVIFQKLLLRNPSVLFSTLFSKPKLTTESLNFLYNNGCEIINIIGKKDALKIIESVKFRNPETVERLNNIIENNPDLKAKILTLANMNNQTKTELGFEDHPIICIILVIILIASIISSWFSVTFCNILYNILPKIGGTLLFFTMLLVDLVIGIPLITMFAVGCLELPYYP